MAKWYEYIPGITAYDKFINEDYTGAAVSMLAPGAGVGYNAYTGAQDELRKGYQDTVGGLRDEAEKQKRFQMQGLDKALSFYQPAQQMVQAAYGSPSNLRK